jgi:hypothetical protein
VCRGAYFIRRLPFDIKETTVVSCSAYVTLHVNFTYKKLSHMLKVVGT